MSFPSEIPLGVPLYLPGGDGSPSNPALGIVGVSRGTLLYTGEDVTGDLVWHDIYTSNQQYLVRSNIDTTWTRMHPSESDNNDMPPGLYTTPAGEFRMFGTSDRYDGPIRIESTAPYFKPRPPGQPPHIIKLQVDQMPITWTSLMRRELQGSCIMGPAARVEIYKLPFRTNTQDIDRFQVGQNPHVSAGATLVTSISNDVTEYPSPIISEFGVPTLYLDVYGWEYGHYVDIWYDIYNNMLGPAIGSFEVGEIIHIPTFSEEIWWAQPVLFPGAMPRDAHRFPVAVSLDVKVDPRIDRTFWLSRFKHMAPRISVMMRTPLTQLRDESDNVLIKDRYLTDSTSGTANSADGLNQNGSAQLDYIYFDRRFRNLWWKYFDGRWWGGGTDDKWLGKYVVDLFFFVEWGMTGCGVTQPLQPTQHGFRCNWALTRRPEPSWGDVTAPGSSFFGLDVFDIVPNQYTTSEISHRDSYKMSTPFTGVNFRTLFDT